MFVYELQRIVASMLDAQGRRDPGRYERGVPDRRQIDETNQILGTRKEGCASYRRCRLSDSAGSDHSDKSVRREQLAERLDISPAPEHPVEKGWEPTRRVPGVPARLGPELGGWFWPALDADRRGEAVAPTDDVQDILSAVGRTSQQFTQTADGDAQAAVFDEGSTPYALGEIGLREHLARCVDERQKKIERLVPDRNCAAVALEASLRRKHDPRAERDPLGIGRSVTSRQVFHRITYQDVRRS